MTGDSTRRAGTTVGGVGAGWPSDIPRPRPPVWDVFDVEVDLRDTGQVVAQLGIDDRLVAGNGLASAGLVAMLADSILGTDAALRARAGIATAVLTVDLVGSPPETGLLRAVSGESGRRAGYLHTTAAIRDAGDIEVARVTGWFAARGGPPVPPSSVAVPSSPAVLPAEPEDRPVHVAPPADGAPTPGAADLPATPLWRTLGLGSFTSGPGGAVAFELPHVGRLSNSGGTLHGGVAALMASVAALATLGDAVRPDVLSMTCHYLRGAGGDGRPVRVTGRQIRRGRTSAVVQGDVLAADGRPAMHTVVTTALHS
jgi:acyl-coenzyme A thioesterase PaaI-like protein